MREEPMFVAGDKAVCIDASTNALNSSARNLVEGKVYVVSEVHRCSCGIVFIRVGLRSEFQHGSCTNCGAMKNNNFISRHRQTRFVPLDTDRALDEAIHESLKGTKIES